MSDWTTIDMHVVPPTGIDLDLLLLMMRCLMALIAKRAVYDSLEILARPSHSSVSNREISSGCPQDSVSQLILVLIPSSISSGSGLMDSSRQQSGARLVDVLLSTTTHPF